MKQFLLSLSFLLGMNSFATHLGGGQIYWEALGNNQYIFYLDMLESGQLSIFPNVQISTNVPGLSTISMTQSSFEYIGDNCSSSGYEGYYHFNSGTVTIPVPVAGNPWVFSISDYIDLLASDNLFASPTFFFSIVSYMYPPGVNSNSARYTMENIIRFFNGNTMQLEPVSGSADSVHVQFDQVLDANLNAVALQTGYTYSTPTSSTDVLHGSGRFVSGNTSPYVATAAFSAVNWHGSSRGSKVNLLASIINNHSFGMDANNDPDLSLIASSHATTFVDTNLISLDVNLDDVISLEFTSTDFDMISSTPQVISAYLNHGTLEGTGLIKPTLNPVNPQTTLANPSTNTFSFDWTVPGGLPEGIYRFVVSVMDDHCGQVGRSAKIIEIHNSGIWQEEFDICSGDSIQLVAPFIGSSYEWIPSTGLSQTNTRVTMASPATDTTYTIKIDGDSVGLYTINVGQHVTPVLIKPQSNQIQLINPNDFDEYSFLYYYVPITYGIPTLTTSASGLYHAIGRNAGCFDLSDSTWITLDSLSSNYIISTPLDWSEFVTFDNSSSYVMNAVVGYLDAALIVDQIIIPGAQITSSTGQLKLLATAYDGTVDTLLGSSLSGHSIVFNLPNSTFFLNGSFEIVMENGTANLPMTKNAQIPMNFDFGEVLSVSGVIEGDTISSGIVPLVFRGSRSIGEKEFGQDFFIYPQPSNEEIRIEGVQGAFSYQILNLTGAVLCRGTGDSDSGISTQDLKTGMYLLHIRQDDQVASFKIVVQH